MRVRSASVGRIRRQVRLVSRATGAPRTVWSASRRCRHLTLVEHELRMDLCTRGESRRDVERCTEWQSRGMRAFKMCERASCANGACARNAQGVGERAREISMNLPQHAPPPLLHRQLARRLLLHPHRELGQAQRSCQAVRSMRWPFAHRSHTLAAPHAWHARHMGRLDGSVGRGSLSTRLGAPCPSALASHMAR